MGRIFDKDGLTCIEPPATTPTPRSPSISSSSSSCRTSSSSSSISPPSCYYSYTKVTRNIIVIVITLVLAIVITNITITNMIFNIIITSMLTSHHFRPIPTLAPSAAKVVAAMSVSGTLSVLSESGTSYSVLSESVIDIVCSLYCQHWSRIWIYVINRTILIMSNCLASTTLIVFVMITLILFGVLRIFDPARVRIETGTVYCLKKKRIKRWIWQIRIDDLWKACWSRDCFGKWSNSWSHEPPLNMIKLEAYPKSSSCSWS